METEPGEKEGASPRTLFLLCFAVLFLEMACIRWYSSVTNVLAFFANLTLVSTFFGLGLGCSLARRKFNLIRGACPLFLVLCLAALFIRNRFPVPFQNEILHYGYQVPQTLWIPFSALATFLLNGTFFMLLGQELGRQFNAFKNPLQAYSYDIAGSLCGTVAFALMGYLQAPPTVWFGLGLGTLLLIRWNDSLTLFVQLPAAAIAILLVAFSALDCFWSPYYKIETHDILTPNNTKLGYVVTVDNERIQDAIDFRNPALLQYELAAWIPYYSFPYQLTQPKKVLLLGAGGGNEAVIAKLMGAEDIQAVEIDPVIASFGFTRHPNRPYTLPGVSVTIDDARAFISRSKEKYDLITLSALDSHMVIPGMSSLRLESYIHTVDGYRQIRSLLKPHGAFCLHMSSIRPWMAPRNFYTVTEAFGKEPQLLRSEPNPCGDWAYLIFNDDTRIGDETLKANNITKLPVPPRPSPFLVNSDDWPFMYLEKPSIPAMCVWVLGSMLLISALLLTGLNREMRAPNLHFYFLGAGFMLLETRSITQCGLLFGLTWVVNVIVVSTVLLAIFVTNFLVMRQRGLSSRVAYPLLFLTLLLSYFFPFKLLLSFGLLPRLLLTALIMGLPICWASMIFSNSFKTSQRPEIALGSNLLGVVLGGALEYFGNILGLKALYLVAMLVYAASWVFLSKSETR